MSYIFPNEGMKGFVNPGSIRVSQSLPRNGQNRYPANVLIDTFSRPDTSEGDIGTSDSGWPWILLDGSFNAATKSKILNNAWVSNDQDTAIAMYHSPVVPIRTVGASVMFISVSGTGEYAKFGMGARNNTSFIYRVGALHLSISRSAYAISYKTSIGWAVLGHGNFPIPLTFLTLHDIQIRVRGTRIILTIDRYQYEYTVSDIHITYENEYAFWDISYTDANSSNQIQVHNAWTSDRND